MSSIHGTLQLITLFLLLILYAKPAVRPSDKSKIQYKSKMDLFYIASRHKKEKEDPWTRYLFKQKMTWLSTASAQLLGYDGCRDYSRAKIVDCNVGSVRKL